jgi:hypothetical protein
MAENGTKHLERLIEDMSASLHRELVGLESSLRQGMRDGFAAVNERLDTIETTLKRHSGMIVSGTVAITTITRTLTKQEEAIRNLQARVRKLEQRKK